MVKLASLDDTVSPHATIVGMQTASSTTFCGRVTISTRSERRRVNG